MTISITQAIQIDKPTALELASKIRDLLNSPQRMGRHHQVKVLVEHLVTLLESEQSKGEQERC